MSAHVNIYSSNPDTILGHAWDLDQYWVRLLCSDLHYYLT